MILQCCCDDSGNSFDDGETPFCVIAGYVATVEQWKAFSDEWQQVLDERPRIDYLRMVEAESLRNQFQNWADTDRDRKLLDLASVVKRHVLSGVGSFISHTAYDAIARNRLPKTLDNPYWFCLQGIVIGSVQMYQNIALIDGKLDFVFDQQTLGIERRAHQIHDGWKYVLREPYSQIIGGISFHNDKEFLPLQAADLLAWHIRRRAGSAILRPEEFHGKRPVAEILWSIPTPTKPWETKQIAEFIANYHDLHPRSPQNLKMKIQVEGKTEFDRFQNLLKAVLAVPHSEIKAKLDAEKKAKERRKRKKAKSSASGRASKSSR